MKIFSKSNLKSIAVLLIVAVLLSGILALLNSVLAVSPKERTMRAIKKIYEVEKEFSTVLDVDSDDPTLNNPIIYQDLGSINKIYIVENDLENGYDLLFNTTGYKGYKEGTISVWCKVIYDGQTYDIETVILESYKKQTLMSKLGADFYSSFVLEDVTEAYKNGKFFTVSDSSAGNFYNPVANATYSANAGNNAVNCVIKYLGER